VVVEALRREVGLEVCDLPFAQIAEAAIEQSWTRDPFDRLIVSQAILRGAPLLTRDRAIRDNCSLARWGRSDRRVGALPKVVGRAGKLERRGSSLNRGGSSLTPLPQA
jgi:hypothetical protein